LSVTVDDSAGEGETNSIGFTISTVYVVVFPPTVTVKT